MTKPLRIAIAGLGTVGAGTVRLLDEHRDLLGLHCGRAIDVVAVSARDRNRDRGIDLRDTTWHDNAMALAEAECDVVVELIGGEDGIALDLVKAALSQGKHVVTANKALLAHHGTELATLAETNGSLLAYEAAVAGGIPIIKALREGLVANRIERVYGILNGTCNYILTEMEQTGRPFTDVLADAQAHGYAEADPSFDIDGIDTAHKLAIITSLAFGSEIDFDSVYVEGIRAVTPLDIVFADELGYRLKLLGVARRIGDRLEQRVHPCMVPKSAAIAHVSGVLNAVVAEGDFVGNTVFEGAGAGAGPTASAVVADLVDVASGRAGLAFGVRARDLVVVDPLPMDERFGSYFVRLMVVDRPGVIADITACFRDHDVSMEAMVQRARKPGEAVPVVVTTHEVVERSMAAALSQIGRLDTVLEPPRLIRIESFDGRL